MCANGTEGLYFFRPGTTMNGAKCSDLKDKLTIQMLEHDCNTFLRNSVPCHRSKLVKNYFLGKNVDVLELVQILILFKTCGI